MPIRWDSKILLWENETGGYGVDPTPTGADNAILATNIVLSPMEGQDVSRELELPWLAAQATIPAGVHVRLQFRVELVPSGAAGTAPAWGPQIRHQAVSQTIVADTSVTYRPISDGHESGTSHFWIGLTRFVIKGLRGTSVMRWTAQGIPYLECDYRGLFSLPSEQARPVPDLSAFLKPDLVTNANTPVFTIDSIGFVMRNAALDLGNTVIYRGLVGSESILITAKAESFTCQVEAVPLTIWDPFAAAMSQEVVPIALAHGTVAGRIGTLAIGGAQVNRAIEFRNEDGILEWGLRFTPLPTAGNDQWSLALT